MTIELQSLSKLKPGSVDLGKLTAGLLSEDDSISRNAGMKLVKDAASFGITVKDYLNLAVGKDPKDPEGMTGYERALFALNLPLRNDYENGISLQAASDTFQTHAGTRALFPVVIDDILRYTTRQDQFEKVGPMLANSRSISGPEVLSTVVDDDSTKNDSQSIAEGTRIPVRSIRTSEKTVKIWKHGSALRMTYEFRRRAALDLIVPHANRIKRQLELSKVRAATGVMINGEGVGGAAASGTTDQGDLDTMAGVTSVDGTLSWPNLVAWLVTRAKAGVPVDTVLMNWDGWFAWLMLFAAQTITTQHSSVTAATIGNRPIEDINAAGATLAKNPASITLPLSITPVISSSMPDKQFLGFTKSETLEELVEAGSQISESEQAIINQTILLTVTENTGYRLVYADTRDIYDWS